MDPISPCLWIKLSVPWHIGSNPEQLCYHLSRRIIQLEGGGYSTITSVFRSSPGMEKLLIACSRQAGTAFVFSICMRAIRTEWGSATHPSKTALHIGGLLPRCPIWLAPWAYLSAHWLATGDCVQTTQCLQVQQRSKSITGLVCMIWQAKLTVRFVLATVCGRWGESLTVSNELDGTLSQVLM